MSDEALTNEYMGMILSKLSEFCDKLVVIDQKVQKINKELETVRDKTEEISLSLDSVIFKMEESNQAFTD